MIIHIQFLMVQPIDRRHRPRTRAYGARSVVCPAQILAALVLSATASHAQPCAPLRVGGFSSVRGGSMSLVAGDELPVLRQVITQSFPDAVLTGSDTLTDSHLSSVDAVLLSPVRCAAACVVSELTSAEQQSLHDFVSRGGTALLFTETTDFYPCTQSLVSPFGLTVTGWMSSLLTVVPDPEAYSVTHGPYGTVQSMELLITGYFSGLGAYAQPLAISSSGLIGVAIITPGALNSGSGLVLAFGDSSLAFDRFRQPDTLSIILNALSEAERHELAGDLNCDCRSG